MHSLNSCSVSVLERRQTKLFSAVHAKSLSQKFLNLLRGLFSRIYDCLRVYGGLSSLFETIFGFWQARLVSSFLFYFVIDQVVGDAVGLQDVVVTLTDGKNL